MLIQYGEYLTFYSLRFYKHFTMKFWIINEIKTSLPGMKRNPVRQRIPQFNLFLQFRKYNAILNVSRYPRW